MTKEKVAIGCDHAGYALKVVLKKYLESKSYDVLDFGTNSEDSVDYADYAHPLANSIENGTCKWGITICGSGNGITMTVNKHQGIRAALCWTSEISGLARAHNNANICSLPGRFVSDDEAKKIVDMFIETAFEGGRHECRINKIPVK